MSDPRRTLRTAGDLIGAGLVPADREREIASVEARYSVAITPTIAELIDGADPDDPIARQFVPDIRELSRHPAERDDPIGDDMKSPVAGLVHRYPDRALLKIASICPVYCRFCFRRERVGPDKGLPLSDAALEAALGYLRSCPKIWEVILTGGDPFALSPRRITSLTAQLGEISHIKVLRWHTRVPVVAPERVTEDLIEALATKAKTVYVAVHANHPREMTPQARAAIGRLAEVGIALVSQTVLLKGVNDDADTLEALMRAFVEARVKPYYLHHADLAPGTSHFRTTIAEGQALMRELRRRLSGLALPTYVLDIPGACGKVPVGPTYITEDGEAHIVSDPNGARHAYLMTA